MNRTLPTLILRLVIVGSLSCCVANAAFSPISTMPDSTDAPANLPTVLNSKRAAWSLKKRELWQRALELKCKHPDWSASTLARVGLHISPSAFARLQKLSARNFQSNWGSCGPQPVYLPNAAELAFVRNLFVQLDVSRAGGRGRGSSRIAAYRLAAASNDPCISAQFKEAVRKWRTRKVVPRSWMRLLDIPAPVLDSLRDSRSTMAVHVSTPRGRMIVHPDGSERPIQPGDIFETDDGTLNFYAWVPWPFGGDRCSDLFHVKLGRWQLFPVIDVASEMCIAFDIVARHNSAYRGEDVRSIIGRTMFEIAKPLMWRLERGVSESKIVRNALDDCGVRVFNAWHAKQKSTVERAFNRFWTFSSMLRGHVGRDRGRYKLNTDLAIACMEGRHDPRENFLSLDAAATEFMRSVELCNHEPIVSHTWGRWVPAERWERKADELARLDPGQASFFAREQRVWTVRKGCVGGNVEGPQVRFPVWFQTEPLWEFEGCKVRVHFDPYAETNTGTIILDIPEWRHYRRGHVIARDVPALDLPPQAVLDEDYANPAAAGQLAQRRAIGRAVRVEMWNYLGRHARAARDGFGNESAKEISGTAKLSTTQARAPISIAANRTVAPRRDRRAELADEAEEIMLRIKD